MQGMSTEWECILENNNPERAQSAQKSSSIKLNDMAKKANEIVGCTKRLMSSGRELTSAVYIVLVRKTLEQCAQSLTPARLKQKLKNWKGAIKLYKSLEKCLKTNDFMNLTCLTHQNKSGITLYCTSKWRKSCVLEKTLFYGRKAS